MPTITSVNGWDIIVEPGQKSQFDFIVRYKQPGRRQRTPKHIHLIIDLYMKQTGNRNLAKNLLTHMLEILTKLKPVTEYPPSLQVFTPNHAAQFQELNAFGEYQVAFLLIIFELIMIQEKTNYPTGVLNKQILELLINDGDIFSVVSTATFR